MKNAIYFVGILILSIFLLQCEKESENTIQINYVKTELGGCNGNLFEGLKNTELVENDTLQFYIKNDILNVFVGVNYICCAPFETNFSISHDSLFFTINDTCSYPYQNCYCRCNCYYIFDFLFTDFAKKEFYFKIVINDPRLEAPIIFREGLVDLAVK